jgi:hypothetical protein
VSLSRLTLDERRDALLIDEEMVDRPSTGAPVLRRDRLSRLISSHRRVLSASCWVPESKAGIFPAVAGEIIFVNELARGECRKTL